MWTGDDIGKDQFPAQSLDGLFSDFDCSLDGGDITANHDRHIGGSDFLFTS